jgi:hypothetical protein
MKTPDEIKKGLECCAAGFYENICAACPYSSLAMAECPTKLKADALTLIRWHEEKNEAMHAEIVRLQAERDAAVENIRGDCVYCLHLCEDMVAPSCFDCANKGYYRWEWRGVQKEE